MMTGLGFPLACVVFVLSWDLCTAHNQKIQYSHPTHLHKIVFYIMMGCFFNN